MSNVHAYAYTRDCGASERVSAPLHAIEALRLFATAARGLMAALRHRRDMRRMERYSNHLLEDVGFERDWDGSIIRRQP